MANKRTRKKTTAIKGDKTMGTEESKMVLSASAQAEAMEAYDAAAEEFLEPERLRANVQGMGVGVKWEDGQPTGKPALVVLVSQKVEKDQLSKADVIPGKLKNMQTDVLTIGYPFAGEEAPQEAALHSLARRIRPAEGGYSVGHEKITAGTIATCVYDRLPGATGRPPAPGIGIPKKFYILSNNHVLANSNKAKPGDTILQPGPYDGGVDPTDRIGILDRFVPITFDPPVPRHMHRNLVDAALAEGQFHDLDREVYWIGYVRGWRRKAKIGVGDIVQKTGRTTNFTIGRITVIKATVDVGYGGGLVARFRDQIITTNMSAPGDSGSLVTTLDNVAVGLLFAGSSAVTIVNQIENVRSLLRVEIAEQIL